MNDLRKYAAFFISVLILLSGGADASACGSSRTRSDHQTVALEKPRVAECKTEAVPQPLVPPTYFIKEATGKTLPAELEPLYKKEKELASQGFVVAYHMIPDTDCNAALVLYEFNAKLAEILYHTQLDLMPRFRRKGFQIWPTVESLKSKYTNDHHKDWRAIGIAASPSLLSNTESPPSNDFERGYIYSAADKPDPEILIGEILIDLGYGESLARSKANAIAEFGMSNFKGVGGSALQLGIRADLAPDYVFICDGPKDIKCNGEEMMKQFRKGTFELHDQVRIIAHPEVFLDAKKGRLHHFPSNSKKYETQKKKFQEFLEKELRKDLEECMAKPKCREKLRANLVVKELATPLEAKAAKH